MPDQTENNEPVLTSKVWGQKPKYTFTDWKIKPWQESHCYVYRWHAGVDTVMTPRVISLLREAFLLDATDEEACRFAGIATPTLYKYQGRFPEFVDQKKAWKESVILKARKKVVSSIELDTDVAFDYLRSKRKDEFSTKTLNAIQVKEGYYEELKKDLGLDEKTLEEDAKAEPTEPQANE